MGLGTFIAGMIVGALVLFYVFHAQVDPHAAAVTGKHILNATVQTAKVWSNP